MPSEDTKLETKVYTSRKQSWTVCDNRKIATLSHVCDKPCNKPWQDIEWARDGDDGKLYIVQARPETVASQKKVGVIEEYKMLEKGTGPQTSPLMQDRCMLNL